MRFTTVGAALVDGLVDERVRLGASALELLPPTPALEHRQHPGRPRGYVQDPRQTVAEGVESLAGVEAEDGAQDDLERQRLEARMQGDRLVLRPARHLALGHLLHEPRQPLHLLAVEGGQHQLPLAEVGPFVEQDH